MTDSRRRKRSHDRELKKERIELRVAPSAKQLIKRAMAVSGLTAGEIAYEGARRVIDEHERMVLMGADVLPRSTTQHQGLRVRKDHGTGPGPRA